MAVQREFDLFITNLITDQIGQHKVLLPIIHKNHNFKEKKKSQMHLSYERKHFRCIGEKKKVFIFEESPNLGVCTLFL